MSQLQSRQAAQHAHSSCGDNELWQTHNKGQHNHTTQNPYGMEQTDKQIASTNEGSACKMVYEQWQGEEEESRFHMKNKSVPEGNRAWSGRSVRSRN